MVGGELHLKFLRFYYIETKVTYPSGNYLVVCEVEKETEQKRRHSKKSAHVQSENKVAQRSEWHERLFRLRVEKMNARIKGKKTIS